MNDYPNDIQQQSSNTPDNEIGKSRNHIWAGLFVLAIGAALLLRQSGFDMPAWLFTWPMILIAVGILSAIKHRFRPGGWIFMLAVGAIFLADSLTPGRSIQQFAWPLFIIALGFWIMLRPKTHRRHFGRGDVRARNRWQCKGNEEAYVERDANDFIDATTVFGGVKKIILSKTFKGGDVVNFMGGTEINLTQADIQGRIDIDATNIFGGTKLIVPATWDVQSDVVAIFGGVDDKRQLNGETPDPKKVIHLSGTCLFGGIEIKSF